MLEQNDALPKKNTEQIFDSVVSLAQNSDLLTSGIRIRNYIQRLTTEKVEV